MIKPESPGHPRGFFCLLVLLVFLAFLAFLAFLVFLALLAHLEILAHLILPLNPMRLQRRGYE